MQIADNASILEGLDIRADLWYGPGDRVPERLYVAGDPSALYRPTLAIVGARRATPYGLACARRFATLAAERGACVVSGGALGVDAAAHAAALDSGGVTVAVVAGDPLRPYPPANGHLFERIVESGGAVVSAQPAGTSPAPFMFRARNAIITGLSAALLVIEAGLPSGMLSMADEALCGGRTVLSVPGNITSPQSMGTNRLISSGARAVVDDASFLDGLASAGLA